MRYIILLCIIPLVAYGDDGSADYTTDTSGSCTVWADHEYMWYVTPDTYPRNNSPLEKSLYPGDMVPGGYTWGSEGCCRISTSFDSVGAWSEVVGGARSYTQHMKIVPDMPTPDSVTHDGYIQTAIYDDTGRSRTHHIGVAEGIGSTPGSKFTINGYIKTPGSDSCNSVAASVTLSSDIIYRNPYWETSIHEHHILTPEGYPASNLDYSQYRYDAIPLEAGSNLRYHEYRWPVISITHELAGDIISEYHCDAILCSIYLPYVPATTSYIGNDIYTDEAVNPPWKGGKAGALDAGEAIFVTAADTTGQIDIISRLYNDGTYITKGYNSTYQFVQQYSPVFSIHAISNTALGGSDILDRPVSVIVKYNGTISDNIHYCSTGIVYDIDGSVIDMGQLGMYDAWGRQAGGLCPDDIMPYGIMPYGITPCDDTPCVYTIYPDEPKSYGWGRWSAVNPETRMLLYNFTGFHYIDDIIYHTPYINWDYTPGTARDFVPACVMDDIASNGTPNIPKPYNWGLVNDDIGESNTYRGLWPDIPTDYIIDEALCEYTLGDRECTPHGAECLPIHDRRCESVFEPFTYPDDYIIAGHERLQDMVISWCGDMPTDTCIAEAYDIIDDVMVDICGGPIHNVDYSLYTQVIDTGIIQEGRFTPNLCHSALAVGLYSPGIDGIPVSDWRICLKEECKSVPGGHSIILPVWDDNTHSVYVPYTPTTGAFAGVVERPGNMLLHDGSLTCACDDDDNNGICDFAESGVDLDGNRRADDYDVLLHDGDITCLDRSGIRAAAVSSCYTKYGRDGQMCVSEAYLTPDGPDGDCDPAIIVGDIKHDGSVSTDNLPAGWQDVYSVVPFIHVDGIIPIPYIIDGEHIHCNDTDPWCVSSGDTYDDDTTQRDICEDPNGITSVKRIPAPITMPPLYKPIFDEHWPPDCLAEYAIGPYSRPIHDVSLDLADYTDEWPTGIPSHVGMSNNTMMLHAGTGIIRFDKCHNCTVPLSADGQWNGTIYTKLGGQMYHADVILSHPPYTIQQEGHIQVVAVEPCISCQEGWRPAKSTPGISIVSTSYPYIDTPATKPEEMVAVACQIDGDGGTGTLNAGTDYTYDYFGDITCRDIPGLSITIQDYEAARLGIAAAREAGQPWDVQRGENYISMDVQYNGIWLSMVDILQHRGQCTSYSWSPYITPGHTACPDVVTSYIDCIHQGGEFGGCFVQSISGDCGGTYTEDDIQKRWEFPEGYTGDIPVVYRFPDGAYGGYTGNNTGQAGLGPLRCEVMAEYNGTIYNDVIYDIPAASLDYNQGGSFACGAVQACKQTQTTYKCMGGNVLPHVTCIEPADSFSVLDIPYDEITSNVSTQNIHIETKCPIYHVYATHATKCDDSIIYDTHVVTDDSIIYVDYFGVGDIVISRGSIYTDTIHVIPPYTFGDIHNIILEVDGKTTDIDISYPCTRCVFEHSGHGIIHAQNVYGGVISGEIGGVSMPVIYGINTEDIHGAMILYLPVIALAVGVYVIISRAYKQSSWD